MDESRASQVYSYIYSHAIPGKGLYGAHQRRDSVFMEYIRGLSANGASILDAGCGRGFLLRWLIADGYTAYGTEIADSLFLPGGELYGMPAMRLFYSELYKLSDDTYDIVVSNDVLEHLPDEASVYSAMKQLSRIAKTHLLVSTGGVRAARCPFPQELGISNLHTVVRPEEWWVNLYETYCDLRHTDHLAGSLFLFGRPR